MSNQTYGGFISVSSGSTILDAVHLSDNGIHVQTDTLTNRKESIKCLSKLLRIGRRHGADWLEIHLDKFDAPFSEVEAWLIGHGAALRLVENHRMFFYRLPLNHG